MVKPTEYVTYKLWNGCKAPDNLEFNGRLIGERVAVINGNRDVCNLIDNGMELCCSKCDWRFDYSDDVQEYEYCPRCGAKITIVDNN